MKMNNPEVSIIIPIYNVEEYIDKCINSVLIQTCEDIEVLLMVGKCKDDSLEKCIKWQKKDERIIILSRKDNSLGDARNYALKIAKGKYVVYVDADDYIDKEFINKLKEPLDKDETIDVSCCGFDKFWSDDTKKYGWLPKIEGKESSTLEKYIYQISYGVVWNKMYRREWLLEKQIEMFDGCHEDDAMNLMMAGQIKNFYLIQKTLYHYNAGNVGSLLHNVKNRIHYFRAMDFALEYLNKFNIYDKNREFIRKNILCRLRDILEETKYDCNVVKESQRFLNQWFPEVLIYEDRREEIETKLYDKIFLFGAGDDSKVLLKRIDREEVAAIVDNNLKLQGTYVNGIPIISMSELENMEQNMTVVISSTKYYYEIADQLWKNKIYNYIKPEEYFIKKSFKYRKNRNIILMNTPEHTNIGDHAIAEAEKLFLKRNFPQYGIIEITDEMYYKYRSEVKKYVNKEDIIVITGGGFLGSLWMEKGESAVRNIMTDYSENKIIIFPQTLYFEENEYGNYEKNISQQVYRSCKDLIIMLREEMSYKTASDLIGNPERCILVPDIVLSLKGYDFERERKKAALCLKSCKESILSEKHKQILVELVQKRVGITDKITMHADSPIDVKERWKIIKSKIEEIGSYKVVITDALHCMILCAISGTPCIAINNISGKLKGVYQWISKLQYIEFVDNLGQIDNALEKVINISNSEFDFEYGTYEDIIKKLLEDK